MLLHHDRAVAQQRFTYHNSYLFAVPSSWSPFSDHDILVRTAFFVIGSFALPVIHPVGPRVRHPVIRPRPATYAQLDKLLIVLVRLRGSGHQKACQWSAEQYLTYVTG